MHKWMKMAAVAMLMLLGAVNAWANSDPKVVVETTVRAIIEVLEARADQNRLTEADRDAIRKVVAGHFDYREMSRRSLGRPWNKISGVQQSEFTELFRELMERSYGNRLAEYNGQKVEFADAEYKKDKARVQSKVIDVNKETPVEYRLHQTKTGWQVYDIRIEGVSLVSTFRKDFDALLQKDGFEGLMKSLKKKVEDLKAQDKA